MKSIEAEDVNTRWVEKKSSKMHEDEHKLWRCVEKESEELEVKMRKSGKK